MEGVSGAEEKQKVFGKVGSVSRVFGYSGVSVLVGEEKEKESINQV